MTYHELVKKVQTALAKADASKIQDHIAVQVNVTGEAEGAFYMEISGGVLYVAPFDYNDRDALLTADGADILNVAQGKISLEAAIAEGKVAHEGNYDKVLALGSTIPEKKAAPKKAAAEKKAEAPAEAAPAEAAPAAEAAKTEAAPAPKKRGRKPAAAKAAETVAAAKPAAPKKAAAPKKGSKRNTKKSK